MSDTAPRPKPAPPKTKGLRPAVVIVDEIKEKPQPKKPFVLRPHLTQRALLNNPRLLELRAELAEKEQNKKPVKRNPRKK